MSVINCDKETIKILISNWTYLRLQLWHCLRNIADRCSNFPGGPKYTNSVNHETLQVDCHACPPAQLRFGDSSVAGGARESTRNVPDLAIRYSKFCDLLNFIPMTPAKHAGRLAGARASVVLRLSTIDRQRNQGGPRIVMLAEAKIKALRDEREHCCQRTV